jgi:hypothetical protein
MTKGSDVLLWPTASQADAINVFLLPNLRLPSGDWRIGRIQSRPSIGGTSPIILPSSSLETVTTNIAFEPDTPP